MLDRLRALFNRAVLMRIDNAHKNQKWLCSGLFGQDKEVEVFEMYGMTSQPPVGKAELLPFCPGGVENHSIAMGASGGAYRPTDGKSGEVIVYTKWDKGSKHRVHFREDKQAIALESGDNSLVLDNEKLVITIGGNTFTMTADNIKTPKDVQAVDTWMDKHQHSNVVNGGSNTGDPV